LGYRQHFRIEGSKVSIPLKGKRVLYVAPRFFGYETEIAEELRLKGAEVDFMYDRPFDTPFMTALTRFKREWIIGAVDRYYQISLSRFDRTDYDIVFVVNGQTLSTLTLTEWRNLYPRANFVLYMWDSFDNRPWAVANLKYFDHCFAFDPDDSKKFDLVCRPLFYAQGFEQTTPKMCKYHISFIGTAHTDRYAIISALSETLGNEINPYWYLYLQSPWVYWAYKMTNSKLRAAKYNEFKFSALSKTQIQSIFYASQAILDIEHPKQTGLTMRTFEALGASKKLVTTNYRVQDYDFFSKNNIAIIDREKPSLPPNFLETPYTPLSDQLYRKYSISGWLDEIFVRVQNSETYLSEVLSGG